MNMLAETGDPDDSPPSVWSDANPEPELSPGPYGSSEDHLWDELCRVDVLVRAQVVRWRMLVASTKPERLWGMVHVSDAEVDAFLRAPFVPPQFLPCELDEALQPYWFKAADLGRIIHESIRLTPASVPLRVVRIASRFGLSAFERDALLVALLPELDGRYRRLFGYLQDDASRTRPTVELIAEILRPDATRPTVARAAFRASSPLRARELILVDDDAAPPPIRQVRIEDRVASYLLGDDAPDPRLAAILARDTSARVAWDDLALHPDRVDRLRALALRRREQRHDPRASAVLLLLGTPGSDRRAAGRAFAAESGEPLWTADIPAALRAPEGFARAIALVHREAALQGAAVAWTLAEALFDRDVPQQHWPDLLAIAAQSGGLTFIESQVARDPEGRASGVALIRVDFPSPGFDARRKSWLRHLPPAGDFEPPLADRAALAGTLANAFTLGDSQVADALAIARTRASARDPASPRISVEDIYEGCRRLSAPALGSLARRIEPREGITFDNLVLAPPARKQVEELRRRIRDRSRVYAGLGFELRFGLGKGLVALFTGPSGTGKTMAAELIAHEQGVDLFKVDLSAIASKWVGETEKNLGRLFDEAESSNAVILIDECEALFSKRGEVKEARDRWANLEANYLLQRIEEYSGMVVLTTNFRQNIDEAFLRRIHMIVEFTAPDAEARARIAVGLFPPGLARPSDDEIRALTKRFPIAGGSLRNVVLDSAFRAVGESTASAPTITMRHLVLATAREYQKLGRPITKADFGEEFYRWVESDLF